MCNLIDTRLGLHVADVALSMAVVTRHDDPLHDDDFQQCYLNVHYIHATKIKPRSEIHD